MANPSQSISILIEIAENVSCHVLDARTVGGAAGMPPTLAI